MIFGLSVFIHVLVVFLVFAGCDVVHPLFVVEIPLDCLLYAFLELQRWLPAEFLLQLGRVDGVACVVSQTVGHVSYQVHVLALLASEQTVHCVYDSLDYVDVLPFVESADVVCLSDFSVMENHVDGTRVVLDIQPVAHILALAIDRERLAVAYVVYEQRNKLLWELVWTVVVGAVGQDSRHAVSVVERTDKMVRARF